MRWVENASTIFCACRECNLVDWLRDENRADGPRGPMGFAIGARMSAALHEEIGKL
jgi:hypothetical protein